MTKVKEFFKRADKLLFSIEVTPPDRGKSVDDIFRNIDMLMPFNPQFINVTYHQPHVIYEEVGDTIIRKPQRKKPGTVGICSAIQNHYKIDTVPHIICGGFDKYETEDALIDLHFLGFENVFVVRGDPPPGHNSFIPVKNGYVYASQMVEHITAMNNGRYIDEIENAVPTDFCIGVAGYPEKHFEAPNLEKDLLHLKEKIEQGADYVITQMFFDFDYYRCFVDRAREMGITVPIIPGIKPITTMRQLDLIPRLFHSNIPEELCNKIEQARTSKEAFEAGTRYMADLVYKLIEYGVPGIHVFTMGKGKSTKALLEILYGVIV